MARKKKDELDNVNSTATAEDESLTKDLLKSLNKDGRHAYSFFDDENPSDIKFWISTGSTLLDYAISNRRNGGIPFGRITEVHGLESSGKSLMMIHVAANTQKMGGIVVYLDTEGRLLNKDFCLRMGLDPKRFIATSPGTIEGAFETIENVIKTTRVKFPRAEKPIMIIWDSVASTPPLAEIEGNYDPQSQMGLPAKAMARGFRKLTETIGMEGVALVCINQLKMNLKVSNPYMDPYITPYGKALPFHASVRVRLTQGKKIKDANDDVIGLRCSAKIVKTSLGPPFRNADFPIMFGYGIDDEQSWYDFLHERGVIKKGKGISNITLNGVDCEFPHNEWKRFLSEGQNKNFVLDLLETLLVKKYDEEQQETEFAESDDTSSEV